MRPRRVLGIWECCEDGDGASSASARWVGCCCWRLVPGRWYVVVSTWGMLPLPRHLCYHHSSVCALSFLLFSSSSSYSSISCFFYITVFFIIKFIAEINVTYKESQLTCWICFITLLKPQTEFYFQKLLCSADHVQSAMLWWSCSMKSCSSPELVHDEPGIMCGSRLRPDGLAGERWQVLRAGSFSCHCLNTNTFSSLTSRPSFHAPSPPHSCQIFTTTLAGARRHTIHHLILSVL